jgi:hypothetical protein
MHAQTSAEGHPSAPLIVPRRPWRVATVEALADYRLRVRFLDGTEGIVAMAALVRSPAAGVFAALADPALFARVDVHLGAVTWPNGIDLAPDAMYAAIKASGEWTLC